MPAGANCSLDSLRAAAGIEHIDLHLRHFDVTVRVGEGQDYSLRHNYSSVTGGKIEFRTTDEQHVEEVITALTGLIDGGQSEDKKSEIDRVRSGGKLIVTINPHSKLSLTELIDFVPGYRGRGLKDPKITGYKLENLSASDYGKVSGAGVPLQEVKP